MKRWLHAHGATVVYVIAMLLVVGYARHLTHGVDTRLSYRNCIAIENVKDGIREQAQATIDGDQKLLDDHDLHGMPLPVPRAAVAADITAKRKTVERYPPRDCGKHP